MAGKDLARTSQTREPGPTIALVMMGVAAAAVIASSFVVVSVLAI